MAAPRLLIVNADELGRSPGVNRGILRAHERGVVTSSSLLVHWPAAEDAARLAREHPDLSVGLHVDLCEWVYRDGAWKLTYQRAPLEDALALESEVDRQLELFRQLLGKEPTHLDSLQDVHRRQPLRDILLRRARERGIPLRDYAPRVLYRSELYGQTSTGEPHPAGISLAAFEGIVSSLAPGVSELRCHPGEADDATAMYGRERELEVELLCDPRVQMAVAAHGVQLCSHRPGRIQSRPSPSERRARRAAVRGQHLLDSGDSRGAWTAVAAHQHELANPALFAALSRALERDGHQTLACTAAERAVVQDPVSETHRSRLELLRGEVRVLTGGWHPPRVARVPTERVPGRVLHVVGASLPHAHAGYTVRTQQVLQAQRRAGLDPRAVTRVGFPGDHGVRAARRREVVDGIEYHRLLPRTSLDVPLDRKLEVNVTELVSLVRHLRPAVLHAASDYQNAVVALAAGRAAGVPVVYEVRGFWEESWLTRHGPDAGETESFRWRRSLELACMHEAAQVVTLGETMRRALVEQGVSPDRISVLPNGVDPQAFAPVGRDAALAQELGLERDEVVVGYVSSFWPYEGIHYLVEAIAALRDRGCRVRCLLVGDGEEWTSLHRQVSALGLTDQVRFTGRVPHSDVLRYYGLIDIFVVPRTPDRVCKLVTPLKPYEAMAAGRAVVVADLPALREIVVDGSTGLVFRPGDVAHLAEVLESLVHDPERRAELGCAARQWVTEHRSWDRIGAGYLELYQRMDAV